MLLILWHLYYLFHLRYSLIAVPWTGPCVCLEDIDDLQESVQCTNRYVNFRPNGIQFKMKSIFLSWTRLWIEWVIGLPGCQWQVNSSKMVKMLTGRVKIYILMQWNFIIYETIRKYHWNVLRGWKSSWEHGLTLLLLIMKWITCIVFSIYIVLVMVLWYLY